MSEFHYAIPKLMKNMSYIGIKYVFYDLVKVNLENMSKTRRDSFNTATNYEDKNFMLNCLIFNKIARIIEKDSVLYFIQDNFLIAKEPYGSFCFDFSQNLAPLHG